MKLYDYYYREDYGHEVYLNLLTFKQFTFLQMYFGFDDFPGKPIIAFTMLGDTLFGFSAYIWRFSVDFDLFTYHSRKLSNYRQYK